jgi:hypothetical protein
MTAICLLLDIHDLGHVAETTPRWMGKRLRFGVALATAG